MNPISKLEHSRPIAPARQATPGGRAPAESPAVAPPAAPQPTPTPAFDMETDIAQRLAAAPAATPLGRDRVAQAFLESCVARSFGPASASDPSFRHVIDQVRDAIRSSAELTAALDRLVDQLAARVPGKNA